MPQVQVDLGDRSYQVLIEPGLIPRLGPLVQQVLPKVQRALVVTDVNVAPRYGTLAKESLEKAGVEAKKATVPAGEAAKTLAQAFNLYTACVNAGLERSSVIIAVGGGVVGDLAGFVAATYLRGIPFVQVPTTLLSQVDSSIGGKVGVDLPHGKNLVGAFHQPRLVLADIDTLATLPKRELSAGMAEVVKHAVIQDAGFMRYLEDKADEVMALNPQIMGRVVEANCRIKATVVAQDERESGIREILNFGHTVGHALETSMGFGGWLHGECVAAGMVAATLISREVGILQEPELPTRLERLLERLRLPVRLPRSATVETLLPLMMRDKKVDGGRIRWVLPERLGEVRVTPDVPDAVVRQVLEQLRG